MCKSATKSSSNNWKFLGRLTSSLFKLMVLLIITMQLTIKAANALETDKADVDKLNVIYIIDNKKVRDLYSLTITLYGYVNDVEILNNSPLNNALISIVADGAVTNGKLKKSLLEFFSETDQQYLSELDLSDLENHNCKYIDNYKDVGQNFENTNKASSRKNLNTSLVIMNSKGWSVDVQLKCLFYGFLVSLGLEKDASIELIKTSTKNIIRQIINNGPFKDR